MSLFSILTTVFRERATGWQARSSNLFLAAFLTLFLVIGVAFLPTADQVQAHATSSIPTNKIQLSSLTMIDHQHGWAFDNHKHIFVTHRGPEHWVDVTPALLIKNPGDIITTSFFLNATHGYIGLLQGVEILLLSTQDGGRTWQTTPFSIPGTEPYEVAIVQIDFLDAQHGWLSFVRDQLQPGEFDFVVMSTTNGGKTWQTVLDTHQNRAILPLPYSTSFRFTFVSPQDGWATGIWLAGDVYLYTTHNGGKTWSKSSITPIKGTHDINLTQSYGPYWQNSQYGTVFVQYDTDRPHLTAYRTLDGGKSWILGPSTPSTTSFQEFSNLSILNAREGWSFGFDGQSQYVIHHTSNSGLTWNVFNPAGLTPADSYQVPLSLTFINNTTGWLIIMDGQGNYNLFQTNTGGHTWHTLNPVTD